jgi:hypothetical protein
MGSMDSLYKTTNGAQTWTAKSKNKDLPSSSYALHFFNDSTGIMPDIFGISKTANSGINWTTVNPNNIYDVGFINASTGCATSFSEEKIYRTTNQGNDWTECYSLSSQLELRCIKFFGSSTGYAVGGQDGYSKGLILKTTDGGNNWEDKSINPVLHGFSGITTVSNGFFYIITFTGRIFRTINSVMGIPDEEFGIAHKFVLKQNYPNPFNPKTVISYILPEAGFTSLKVYDIIGNEVEILVSQKQSSGSYSVPFDASKLPSGIYFYKLEAGDFIDTKRMVLIK